MNKKWSVIIVMVSLLIFVGCTKGKDDVPAENIIITFTEPVVGDSIASYNSLHCEGTITSDGDMKGYSIVYVDQSTNDVLFETSYNTQAEAYNIHEHWLNNVTTTTQVIVRVIAKKDNNGNTETKELTVTCLQ